MKILQNEIIGTLVELGLSESEVEVYLYLISKPSPVSTSIIAEDLKYDLLQLKNVLNLLLELKVISQSIRGKVEYYYVSSASNL